MSLYDLSLRQFLFWVLVLFRVSGLIFFAPFFGSGSVPTQVKAGMSIFLALLIYPLVPTHDLTVPDSIGVFVLAAALETAVGALIGFIATLFFVGVQFAGMLIDQELGLSLANVIDPITNEQTSIIGQLKFFMAVLFFLALDGHHYLLTALAGSFREIPLLGLRLQEGFVRVVTEEQVREMFSAGIRIAAPTVVSLLLTTLGMAFIARIAPEMNVFIMAFTFRLLVGLGIILVSMPVFAYVFDKDLSRFFHGLPEWIRLMR